MHFKFWNPSITKTVFVFQAPKFTNIREAFYCSLYLFTELLRFQKLWEIGCPPIKDPGDERLKCWYLRKLIRIRWKEYGKKNISNMRESERRRYIKVLSKFYVSATRKCKINTLSSCVHRVLSHGMPKKHSLTDNWAA